MAARGMADTADAIRDRVVSKWNQRLLRTLTPEQVERARAIITKYDSYIGRGEFISHIEHQVVELLREVVGDE